MHTPLRFGCLLHVAGTVIDLDALFEELAPLDEAGIEWRGRLFLSDRATLLFDFHKVYQFISSYTIEYSTIPLFTKVVCSPSL